MSKYTRAELEVWFPGLWDGLDILFAHELGVTKEEWKEAKDTVAIYNAWQDVANDGDGLGRAIALVEEARTVPVLDKKDSWKEGDEEFVEFFVRGESIRETYLP